MLESATFHISFLVNRHDASHRLHVTAKCVLFTMTAIFISVYYLISQNKLIYVNFLIAFRVAVLYL